VWAFPVSVVDLDAPRPEVGEGARAYWDGDPPLAFNPREKEDDF